MKPAKQGPDHQRRNRLLIQHQALVRSIAQAYARQSAECLDDLMQVGWLGLVRAAERFESKTGIPFDCFARPHVRGAILHYLRDRSHRVRLPRRQQEWQQKLINGKAAEGKLQAGLPVEDHDRLQSLRQWTALRNALPLEDLAEPEQQCWISLSGESSLSDGWHDASVYTPRHLAPAWEAASIERLLALVDRRQRQVLSRVILRGWSYRRTARDLGTSAPTVQRLLHKALAELRDRLSCGESPANKALQQIKRRRAGSAAPAC